MPRLARAATIAAATAGLLAGGTALAAPSFGSAAPPGTFEVDYDAVGTTHVAKPNSDVKLGPTVVKTFISTANDGTFTGSLPLPPTTSTFAIAGLVPVTAKVNFIPTAPLKGTISDTYPLKLKATASYYIKLTDVYAGGLPANVGDTCRTHLPVSIPVATPAGKSFDLDAGGPLAGTYTIGDFEGCGITNALVNLLVSGPGNTVSLNLSHGRFVE